MLYILIHKKKLSYILLINSLFSLSLLLFFQPLFANNNFISRSTFTSGINNREPIDQLTVIPKKIKTIYYFTALNQLKGKTVRHNWYINGKPTGGMSFKIKGNHWRINTKKTVTTKGTISVLVTLDDGTVIQTANIASIEQESLSIPANSNIITNALDKSVTSHSVDTALNQLTQGDPKAQAAIAELLALPSTSKKNQSTNTSSLTKTVITPIFSKKPTEAITIPLINKKQSLLTKDKIKTKTSIESINTDKSSNKLMPLKAVNPQEAIINALRKELNKNRSTTLHIAQPPESTTVTPREKTTRSKSKLINLD